MFRFLMFLLSLLNFILSTMGIVFSSIIGTPWIAHALSLLFSGIIIYWSVKE